MTIPEIYAEAARRLRANEPEVERLGTAHPDYQEALKRYVTQVTREQVRH